MGTEPTPTRLAEILPGRWQIRASNLLHWLNGERLDPVVELSLNSTRPLILGELVQFATSDGKERVVRSRSIWNGNDFVTRKLGMRPSARRWTVPGTSEDGNVIVVRHGSGRSAGGGIDVLVRENSDASEIRALVARESENFELSLEDFASLSWFPVPSGGRP
ncbi:MAG: hypothetical protein WED09_14860 [Homoserinimonas sp.]